VGYGDLGDFKGRRVRTRVTAGHSGTKFRRFADGWGDLARHMLVRPPEVGFVTIISTNRACCSSARPASRVAIGVIS
jgi:hypothetical protein